MPSSRNDKDNFNKNPVKEVNRLIDILIIREKDEWDQMNSKWRALKRLTCIASWIYFKKIKDIKEIVSQLDINKIKLSKEDIYWTDLVPSYDYGGISYEQRVKNHKAVENKCQQHNH